MTSKFFFFTFVIFSDTLSLYQNSKLRPHMDNFIELQKVLGDLGNIDKKKTNENDTENSEKEL